MSDEKRKVEKDPNSIPSYIVEAISNISPDFLLRSESSPSYPIETFNISEILNSSKKKKEKEKEYKIGNYLIKKTLGQGTFGKVKLGIYIPSEEKVAIKILEKDRIVEKDDEIRVKREFDMLALFNHPNVILVAEIFESNDSYYSVMEYCEGGELFNYIVKNRRLSENESAFFYYQLINGLEYIHSLGIVHRDLKPENLLLTKDHLLKIIDFGLSNYFNEKQTELLITPCGSPCYASPEMVAGKKYNGFKIDIWSTGIILFAMLCGYLPFEDKDNDILFEKILECKLVFPKYVSKIARDLIEKILVTDPDKRISIDEIKKHPLFLKGKSIFEEEFNVSNDNRVTLNEKKEMDENIDINNILVNGNQNEKNNKKDDNEIKKENNKENENTLNIKNIKKSDINLDNEKENKNTLNILNSNEKQSNLKENNNEKENKISLGINDIEINPNINQQEKEKIERKEKEKKIEENNTYKNRKKLVSNLEKENLMQYLNTEYVDKNLDLRNKILEPYNKEDIHQSIIKNTLKKQNISGTNSTQNKAKNIIIKKNFLGKNKDYFKYNKEEIRSRLIKNGARLDIRTKSREYRSNNKNNKTINFHNFHNFNKYIIQKNNADISPKLKTTKHNNNRNLIRRRINYTNIIQNKFSSKESLHNRKLNKKGNIYLNNINNSIDNEKMPYKIKVNFNFQNIYNYSSKNSKRTKSTGKNNMKMSSYGTNVKKNKKYLDNLININSNIKKYERKLNYGNWTNKNNDKNEKNDKKIKGSIKEINTRFNDDKIKDNLNTDENTNLYNLYRDNLIKTEISKEKGKYQQKIKKIKIPNINTNNINNGNIKINIIENANDSIYNNTAEKNKQYNTNTSNMKSNLIKIIQKKSSPRKKQIIVSKNKIEKYIKKTFEKSSNSNRNMNISGNINIANSLNHTNLKKTIDIKDNKKHKININILDNIEYIKTNDSIKNNTAHYTRKKINNNFIKKAIGNKTEIIEKENLNKKNLLNDIHISSNNSKVNTIDEIFKSEKKEKVIEPKKNFLDLNINNNNKNEKKHFVHIKLNSINTKTTNHKHHKNILNHYKKINSMISNQKILNKTNNSNISSSLKNPFLNESNYIEPLNPQINYNYNINNNYPTINYLNRKFKNSQIISHKKKPCVTIRNTVINVNMIDSGLLLASLNRKKASKKKNKNIGPNNSVNRIQNNRLYGLCSKYSNGNTNNSINNNNNNLMSGNGSNFINFNNSIGDNFPLKTKTINVNSNTDLNYKIYDYGDKNGIKEFRKLNNSKNRNINKKKISNIQNKIHTKYNSMKFSDFDCFKREKKEIKKLNINNLILNSINDNNFIHGHFNTSSNEVLNSINERNKRSIIKK